MNIELNNKEEYSPYCPVCSGCGEDGCCSAVNCKQDPEGHHCETYLKELKLSYSLLKNLDEIIFKEENKEKYKELIEYYDYYFDLHWERYFNNIEKKDNNCP
jgi:hypothetical protein